MQAETEHLKQEKDLLESKYVNQIKELQNEVEQLAAHNYKCKNQNISRVENMIQMQVNSEPMDMNLQRVDHYSMLDIESKENLRTNLQESELIRPHKRTLVSSTAKPEELVLLRRKSKRRVFLIEF